MDCSAVPGAVGALDCAVLAEYGEGRAWTWVRDGPDRRPMGDPGAAAAGADRAGAAADGGPAAGGGRPPLFESDRLPRAALAPRVLKSSRDLLDKQLGEVRKEELAIPEEISKYRDAVAERAMTKEEVAA
jgi:hypothetical protein